MIQIVPEKYSTELCVICMDEKNIAKSHDCTVCKEDAWKICDSCKNKSSICPVCRTSINPISSDNIVVEIPPFQQQQIQNNLNVAVHRNSLSNNCKEFFELLLCSIKLITQFFIVVYLGKIYIYTYCAGTCDVDNRYIKKEGSDKITDRCTCYDYANIDGYWEPNSRFFVEFMLGVIVSGILFGCCVKEN